MILIEYNLRNASILASKKRTGHLLRSVAGPKVGSPCKLPYQSPSSSCLPYTFSLKGGGQSHRNILFLAGRDNVAVGSCAGVDMQRKDCMSVWTVCDDRGGYCITSISVCYGRGGGRGHALLQAAAEFCRRASDHRECNAVSPRYHRNRSKAKREREGKKDLALTRMLRTGRVRHGDTVRVGYLHGCYSWLEYTGRSSC